MNWLWCQACIQVCHDTLLDPNLEASHLGLCRAFLYDRCALLRSAFHLHGLLLQPGSAECGSAISWCSSHPTTPTVTAPSNCHRPLNRILILQPVIADLVGARDDTEAAATGWADVGNGVGYSETLRVEVADIKLHSTKGLKWLGSKLKGGPGSGAATFGGAVTAVLYPRARPKARVEWPQTVVGTGKEAQLRASTHANAPRHHLEVLPDDKESEGTLELELQTGGGASQLARARVTIHDIWQVRAHRRAGDARRVVRLCWAGHRI